LVPSLISSVTGGIENENPGTCVIRLATALGLLFYELKLLSHKSLFSLHSRLLDLLYLAHPRGCTHARGFV
jgi:hypothetical protein